MRMRNYTPFPTLAFASTAKDGRKFRTIVAKATFAIEPDRPLRLVPEQLPLTMADEYYGELNVSSVRVESDLAPAKPATDVYFDDPVAHAPGGRPEPSWDVRVEVGPLKKAIRVHGPRSWEHGLLAGWKLTPAEPVASVPIRYELAFGGHWKFEDRSEAFDRNYVGRGFVHPKLVDKSRPLPAPQLEDPTDPLVGFNRPIEPAGLGPITKTWQPRLKKAGTFDAAWKESKWPAPPDDADAGFYNCAPPGLLGEGHLRGDEPVTLTGLSPDGPIRFRLPGLAMTLVLRMESGEFFPGPTFLDTVVFAVGRSRATLVWRGYAPIDPPVRLAELRVGEIPKEGRRRGG